MESLTADLCIVGAGSGGLNMASAGAQLGARVVLVEGHRMGGDCLNTGCVPSKALLAAARAARERGIQGPAAHAAALAQVRAAIDAIAPHDSQDRFEGLGMRVIRAWGSFADSATLVAGDCRITARRFVIATGSVALVPPIPGLAEVPYLTNETLFDLQDFPRHLLILGGGPIGVEMALAHHRLGAQVTLIDAGPLLGRDDPEAARLVADSLAAEGVRLLTGTAVRAVSGQPGAIVLHTAQGDVTGSHLLVAAGRRPALDRLALTQGQVAFGPGGVTVDRGLRSVSNRRVYAVGDAAGGPMFTHVAAYQAGVLVRAILLGLPARARTDHLPRVTYADPELAQIGPTEAEARARHGPAVEVVRLGFDGNDRAVTEQRTDGLIKLMVLRGRPIGVTIVGAHAGELIAPWALAISARLRLSAVAGMVLPYPTLSEVSKRAAGAYFAPRLFRNVWIRRLVRGVQRLLP